MQTPLLAIEHNVEPFGPHGTVAGVHVLPPMPHLYPSRQPVVLRAEHVTAQEEALAHGNPLHDWFLTVEQAPAPSQYWVVVDPAVQVDELHGMEPFGYVQAALEPLQYPLQVASVPLQDFPDGGVVTFVQVAVAADAVQVSQDPVQERLP
jgi:hypothetical protein